MDLTSDWRVPPREAWREYMRLFRGNYLRVALAVAVSVTPAAISGLIAILIKKYFDDAFKSGNRSSMYFLVGAFVGLQLLAMALNLLARYLTLEVTKRAVVKLRMRLFDRLLQISRTVHDRTDSAALHAIVSDDSERIDVMSNAIVSVLLPSTMAVLVVGGVLLYISPTLFVVIAIAGPLAFFSSRALRGRVRRSIDLFRRAFTAYSRDVFGSIRLLDLIRTQSAQPESRRVHGAIVEKVRSVSARTAWMQTAYPMFHQSVMVVLSGVVLLMGGIAISAGRMTVGELMAFFTALVLLRNQTGPLMYTMSNLMQGENALERVFGFLKHVQLEPYQGTKVVDFDGSIVAEGIGFHYEGGPPVLQNVSLATRPGAIVAVTGENGCGKTTLLHVLLGFYAPSAGRISASGVPYAQLDLLALRRQIGFVGQESMILDATVRENIVFGATGITEEDIRGAIALGCAEDFVASLPDGLDTLVGEDGVLLSGGQRQRIALTRALLHQPQLLVLDEPTNHLDRGTVTEFIRNLRRTHWPHATLVVSHDTEVVAQADEILVMREGRLEPAAVPTLPGEASR